MNKYELGKKIEKILIEESKKTNRFSFLNMYPKKTEFERVTKRILKLLNK